MQIIKIAVKFEITNLLHFKIFVYLINNTFIFTIKTKKYS